MVFVLQHMDSLRDSQLTIGLCRVCLGKSCGNLKELRHEVSTTHCCINHLNVLIFCACGFFRLHERYPDSNRDRRGPAGSGSRDSCRSGSGCRGASADFRFATASLGYSDDADRPLCQLQLSFHDYRNSHILLPG